MEVSRGEGSNLEDEEDSFSSSFLLDQSNHKSFLRPSVRPSVDGDATAINFFLPSVAAVQMSVEEWTTIGCDRVTITLSPPLLE